MKKFLSILICLTMMFALAVPALAAEATSVPSEDVVEPKVVSYYSCLTNAKVYREESGKMSDDVIGIMKTGEQFNGLSVTLSNYIRGYPVSGDLYNLFSSYWGSSLYGYTIRSAYSFLGNDSPLSENAES